MSNLKKQQKINKISTYFLINVIVLVFFIFGVFWLQLIKTNTIEAPKCNYKKITGKDCPTCGITRDFVRISKFEKLESHINSKSIYYFSFFVYIAISRLFVVVLSLIKKTTKPIIVADIVISILAFISLIVFSYLLI